MKNKDWHFINDMADIQFRMSCGIRAVRAVHELIEGVGGSTAESYADALYGVCDYLGMLNDEFRLVIDGAIDHDVPCDKEAEA